MALVALLLDQGEHDAAVATLKPIRRFETPPVAVDGYLERLLERYVGCDRSKRGAESIRTADLPQPKSSLERFLAAFRAARLKNRDRAVEILGESPQGQAAEYLAIGVWFDASSHTHGVGRSELRRRVVRTSSAIESRLGYATARTLYFRGSALSGLGQPEPAFHALQRAHALGPSFGATFNLARQCILSNRLARAEQLAFEARKLRPNNRNADVLLADVLCRRTKFDAAEEIAKGVPTDGHLVKPWDRARVFASIAHHRMIRALAVPDMGAARSAARECVEHCASALTALPKDSSDGLRASLDRTRRLAHAVLRRRRSFTTTLAFSLRSDPTNDAKVDALSVALTNVAGDDAEQALQQTANSLKAIAAALRLARITSRKKTMIKLVTSLALLVTSGMAQDPPPAGNLAEIPVFLTASGTADECELHHVNLGGMSAAPVKLELPEYGRDPMFPNTALKMAGFSRGVAFFPLEWDAEHEQLLLKPQDTQWSFVMFAVQAGTVGQDEMYPPSAEKHIYAYQDGSDVPEHLRGRVEVVRNGDEMGVDAVRGIDSYAFTRLLGSDTGDEGNLTIYFSLYADSIPENSDYRPCDIYKKTYNGESWSGIQTYLTAEQLGLDPTDQIDAVCVDEDRGYLLLSVKNAGQPKELWGSIVTNVEAIAIRRSGPVYSSPDDYFVTERLGFAIELDGIVGICSDDPELRVTQVSAPAARSNGLERPRIRIRSPTSNTPWRKRSTSLLTESSSRPPQGTWIAFRCTRACSRAHSRTTPRRRTGSRSRPRRSRARAGLAAAS